MKSAVTNTEIMTALQECGPKSNLINDPWFVETEVLKSPVWGQNSVLEIMQWHHNTNRSDTEHWTESSAHS